MEVEVERAIKLLDVSGDGKISKAEFSDWWLNRGEDLDGDGVVSETEKKLSKVATTGFEKQISFVLSSMMEDRLVLKREEVALEEKRAAIQKKIDVLSSELSNINKKNGGLLIEKEKCDAVIKEVEQAFFSIMEASQSLLHTTKTLGTKLDSKLFTSRSGGGESR